MPGIEMQYEDAVPMHQRQRRASEAASASRNRVRSSVVPSLPTTPLFSQPNSPFFGPERLVAEPEVEKADKEDKDDKEQIPDDSDTKKRRRLTRDRWRRPGGE